jgi:SAM-dependent methyltransferase
MNDTARILRHYGSSDIRLRLEGALREARLGEGRLSPADLAPLDQFHTRGLAATVELAEAAGVERGELVIDIGSGLGGPSRYLATKFDCRVHGVDLNPAFVEAATWLADRTGLSGKVSYDCADAEALPYQDGRFDLAWTQHVAMNIANRARLYREVHRVLRPGARFAVYDVVAGMGGPVHFRCLGRARRRRVSCLRRTSCGPRSNRRASGWSIGKTAARRESPGSPNSGKPAPRHRQPERHRRSASISRWGLTFRTCPPISDATLSSDALV